MSRNGSTTRQPTTSGAITRTATLPLGTWLADTAVSITDGAGVSRPALLLFTGPTQVNLDTPAGMAAGSGTLTITNVTGQQTSSPVTIDRISPGLFSADQNGQGVAAAVVLHISADGSQSSASTATCSGSGPCQSNPIDLSPASDQVFLSLYGTGIRDVSGIAGVSVTVGGLPVEVRYAGAQSEFAGLDQVKSSCRPRSPAWATWRSCSRLTARPPTR